MRLYVRRAVGGTLAHRVPVFPAYGFAAEAALCGFSPRYLDERPSGQRGTWAWFVADAVDCPRCLAVAFDVQTMERRSDAAICQNGGGQDPGSAGA